MPEEEATPRRRGGSDRQSARGKLACLRCQRRKIRCDGGFPVCKNCRNAGAACTDGLSARLKDLPRAEISGLKSRIAWLESIIRQRCPDVDLDNGQPDADIDPAMLDVSTLDADASTVTNPGGLEHISAEPNITAPPTRASLEQGLGNNSAPAHEIGMLSLGASQDSRYIGPSSGYFLARVMLSRSRTTLVDSNSTRADADIFGQLIESSQGPLPLPARQLAQKLCDAYFEYIHPQYPILHHTTIMNAVDLKYQDDSVSPAISFQVWMVLAIGATVLSSRSRARLPSDSYCVSALQHFSQINIENSLQGLQCLLLLQIFALHNPSTRFNVWYLNYQCLAAVLDLGLQRDITVESGITLLEQEMRTRIFWVCLLLDRTICTMMGRPIGLRDEACELRLPREMDDNMLVAARPGPAPNLGVFGVHYSVHLFRATKLNSEIKYVANSIVQEAPRYAYPPQTDIHGWQDGVLQQLDEWLAQIPTVSPNDFMDSVCRLRYHGLCMLLLRPSPAVPKPTKSALLRCHTSAVESIKLLESMYRKNMLIHNWITLHGLVLGVLTLLYCIKAEPEVARVTDSETLMTTISSALSILSATGEHWCAAKTCRDILDDLAKSTAKWLHSQQPQSTAQPLAQTRSRSSRSQPMSTEIPMYDSGADVSISFTNQLDDGATDGGFDPFMGLFQDDESVNIDVIMQNLFQDFIPSSTI